MSILVFGKTGQLARELALLDGVTCLGRAQVDLSDPAACAEAIGHYAPVAVINAAAYTAVDRAEEEDALAQAVNGADSLEATFEEQYGKPLSAKEPSKQDLEGQFLDWLSKL